MPTVRTDDGVQIAYEVVGSGPINLLFLHGWGGSAKYWDEMLRKLNLAGLRAICASYRGHGDSDKCAHGYTLDRFAKDMFAVADGAGAEKMVLVGYSMSGKYAQYMAVMQPERVLALVLIAPCAAGELPFPNDLARSWADAAGNRQRCLELLAPFVKLPVNPELVEAFLGDFVKVSQAALAGTIEMFSKTSFLEKAMQIRVPTLVVAGAYDPLLTPDYQRDNIIPCIRGSRLVVLPCGHEIPHEMAREAAWLLEAFVAGLKLAA